MATLSKQTSKPENASLPVMGGSVVKQDGKNLSASQSLMGATNAKQIGKSTNGSMSAFSGTFSKSRLLSLLASMANFGPPNSVQFNNTNAVQYANAGSLSGSFTVTPGSPNLCAFAIVWYDGAGASIASVTYGGVAMISCGTPAFNSGNNTFVQVFYLPSPLTGSNTLAVTGSSVTEMYANVISFYNVAQGNPTRSGTYVEVAGSSPFNFLQSIESSISDLTLGAIVVSSASVGLTTNQTLDGSSTSGSAIVASDHATTPAGTVTDIWSPLDGLTVHYAYVGFSIASFGAIDLSKQTNESVPASMATFSTSSSKQDAKNATASMAAFSGTTGKQTTKTALASMGPFSGSLAKQFAHTLSAAMASFAGSIAAQATHIFSVTINAAMSAFSGSRSQQTGKRHSGSMSSFGASNTKQTAKNQPASLAPFSVSIGKQTGKLESAVMSLFNGLLTAAMGGHQYTVSIAASMALFSANQSKQTTKGIAGSMAKMSGSVAGVLSRIVTWIAALFGFVLPELVCVSASVIPAMTVSSGVETLPMVCVDAETFPAMITSGGSVTMPLMSSGGVVQDFPFPTPN